MKRKYSKPIGDNHTGKLLRKRDDLNHKTTVEETDFNVRDFILTSLANDHWEKLVAKICANE